MNLNENLFECSEQKKPTPKSDAYKIWARLKENESIDLENLDEWAVRRACSEHIWTKDTFMHDLKEELSEQKPLTEETIGSSFIVLPLAYLGRLRGRPAPDIIRSAPASMEALTKSS